MRQSFWWYLLMDLWFENDLFLGHFPFESKRNCFNFVFYFVKLEQMLFFMIIFRNTDMLTTLCLKTPFWWKDFWTIGGKLGGRFVIAVDFMLFVFLMSSRIFISKRWVSLLTSFSSQIYSSQEIYFTLWESFSSDFFFGSFLSCLISLSEVSF